MNEDLIFDLIKECTKIFNDIKKKNNEDLNTLLVNCLNNLNSLKEILSKKETEHIDENKLSISSSFLESSKMVITLKYNKYFLNLLILLKKFIEYNLLSNEKSSNIIELLKLFYNNSKINDECQNKIIEILQTLLFTSFLEMKFDVISNIYIIILKSFNNANHSKNKDFKNPIRLILTTLTEKVYSSNNFEIIIQTTYLIFSWYNLGLKKKIESISRKSSKEINKVINEIDRDSKNNEVIDDIDDNLKEEVNSILSKKKNDLYIQCLSLELLSQGFTIMNSNKEKGKKDNLDMSFLNKFLKNKVLKAFMVSIENIKKNISVSEEELNYIHYLKICRLSKIIIFNYDINYDIIQSIIDLITENKNKISWKLYLSFEFVSKIVSNYELLGKIYIWKKELLNSIFSSIKDFKIHIELLKEDKDNKKIDNIISSLIKKKEIDSDKIYLEGDQIEIFKEYSKKLYKKLFNECLQNIIDSLPKDHKIIEELDKKSENKISYKEIFDKICENIKDLLFKLLYSEFRKINNETNLQGDCEIKIYINFMQNMMGIFNNLKMYDKRDEYLQYLCNLALDFSDDKNEDKNIFMAINILGISNTTNLLNKDAFVLILKTLQAFNRKYNYIKLNEYSKNDIDKIIKDINKCYKKYNKLDIEEIPIHYIDNIENILDDENDNDEKKDKLSDNDENEEKKEDKNKEEDIKEKKEEEDNIKNKNHLRIIKEEEENAEEDEKEEEKEEEIKEEVKDKEIKEEIKEKDDKEEKDKEEIEKEIKEDIKEENKEDKKEVKNNKNENIKKDKNKKDKDKIKKDKDKDKKVKNKKDKDKKEKEKRGSIKSYNFAIEMRNKLIEGINTMFLDSKNLDLEALKYIFEALSACLESSIKKYLDNSNKINEKEKAKEKEKELQRKNSVINKDNNIYDPEIIFNYQLIFYFSKILTLILLNVDKIYILFDPFLSVINKFIDNKLKVDFSFDIICSLIPEILLNHEKIESNIKDNLNEEEKAWVNEKWQKLLFKPLLNILSQSNIYGLIKERIFFDLNKIIQQCGHFIDLYGWESIIQLCTILCNYDIENTFLAVKQMLNDYNVYIALFNIIPLMELLQLFLNDKDDKNTCFSSVELFWSCANIIDDFKQEKRKINEKEKLIYDSLLKGKEIKIYCDEIYNKLFSYLISINNDKRLDVRKSGLNVFTEIFVSKMNSIKSDDSLKIINDIFFKVFSSNADKYISNNSDIEQEQTLQISLFNIIKIFKEYFNENQNQNELFDNYLKKIMEIIPKASTPLNTDILKSILEIKPSKNENMPMIASKFDIFFKILLLIRDYIKSPIFTISQFNKVPTYKLFNSIINYLSSIYMNNKNIEIFTNDNLKNMFSLLDTLLEEVYSIEPKLLEIKPRKIMDYENDIFGLLEKIPVENNLIYNYIIDKMIFDYKTPHTEAICFRAFECIQNMICKEDNKKNNFGLKKEEKEIFEKAVKKLIEIMNLRDKNEIIQSLINTCADKNNLKEGIVFAQYINYFIKILDKLCSNFSNYKESINDENKEEKKDIINNIYEIFYLTLDLFETIFKQSINGFQDIDKSYLPIVNEVYQQMEIESINFIINKLLFYILFILGDEDQDIFEKIEEKIIKVIKLSCDISYNNSNINNSSPDTLNQICINELFEICRYKSNEEILSKIKDNKIKINKDKYINNQIKIGKICTTLLIQKIIELLKNFREDEIKSGEMPLTRSRIQEIVILLQNTKTLEVFPNINLIEKNEIKKDNFDEITVYDVISKSKKIHLFFYS